MAEYNFLLLRNKLSRAVSLDPVTCSDEQLKALKVVFASCRGYKLQDREEVLADIFFLSSSKDARLKKLVYFYLTLVIDCDPDVMLHITNSASHDLTDPNPIVRGSTLRSITELTVIPDVTFDLMNSAILCGLQDHSPMVRCIAIDGIIRLNRTATKSHFEYDEQLSSLLDRVVTIVQNDPDPSVVVRCVDCLAACKHSDKIVHEATLSLISRITLLDSWLAISVLHRANMSIKHDKLNEGEIFGILNKLDPVRALSTTPATSLEALSMMYKSASKLEDVKRDVLMQIISHLLSLYSVSDDDMKYLILCNLLTFLATDSVTIKDQLVQAIRHFKLLLSDSAHVLIRKLEILCYCVTKENAMTIFSNIRLFLHKNLMKDVVTASFYMLEVLHEFIPEIFNDALLSLLHSKSSVVVDAAVATLYSVTLKTIFHNRDYKLPAKLYNALLMCYDNLKAIEARSSFLWIISQTEDASLSKQILKILKTEVSNLFVEQYSNNHQHCILTTTVILFLKWPQVFHNHIKDVLTKVLQSTKHNSLKEKAKLYYRLLKIDKSLLKSFVTNSEVSMFALNSNNMYKSGKFNCIRSVSTTFD